MLILLACATLIANIFILGETKKLVNSFSNQQNQATWFLFQLNKELLELVSNANHLGDGDDHLPEVLLKYELAWSRFDLIMTNEEADDFMSLSGTRSFFSKLFEQYKNAEPLLSALEEKSNPSSLQFVAKIETVHDQLIDYTNRNFRVASPLYLERREQVNDLERMQTALLLLLVFCIGIISFVFSSELKHSRRLALTDTLTTLPNRLALFNVVDDLYNNDRAFKLFLLDLDGFKQVNDQFGHQVGDEALVEVAKRIQVLVKTTNLAFRIGGDEFAIIMLEEQLLSADRFCQELVTVFKKPFCHEQMEYELSTSIGYASFPSDSMHIDELIRYADKRMYHMKFEHRETTADRRHSS